MLESCYKITLQDQKLKVETIDTKYQQSIDQWTNRKEELQETGGSVPELFFPDQRHHDAYVEIRAILQRASRCIVIIDPYIDQSILTLVSTCVKAGMSIRLLTSKLPPDFSLEGKKWRSQHGGNILEVRTPCHTRRSKGLGRFSTRIRTRRGRLFVMAKNRSGGRESMEEFIYTHSRR